MSVLGKIQEVSSVIGLSRPTQVFSSTEREHIELQDCANEVRRQILERYEWQILKKRHTIAGDGSSTAFNLPSDFNRMLKKARIWSTRIQTPYRQIMDLDEWEELDVRQYEFVVGVWIIVGGQIQVKPAPAVGETLSFWYVGENIVTGSGSVLIPRFVEDTDVLRINEEILKLGIIWQWKANKGRAYAEDLETFETAIAKQIDLDKGPRIITDRKRRVPKGLQLAYPTSITP